MYKTVHFTHHEGGFIVSSFLLPTYLHTCFHKGKLKNHIVFKTNLPNSLLIAQVFILKNPLWKNLIFLQ